MRVTGIALLMNGILTFGALACGGAPREGTRPPTPESTLGEAAALPVIAGEVARVRDENGTELFGVVVLPRPDHPRPSGPVLGIMDWHGGSWQVREVESQSTPYRSLEAISAETACHATIARARLLHAFMDAEDSPLGEEEQQTFLAFEFTGCSDAEHAILGSAVVHHPLVVASLPRARPALEALIRAADASYENESTMEGFVRAFELPERRLAAVFGHRPWLVRDQALRDDYPLAVIEAGARTFVLCGTTDSDVLLPIEEDTPFERTPESADLRAR
jgi:hypothetical protein